MTCEAPPRVSEAWGAQVPEALADSPGGAALLLQEPWPRTLGGAQHCLGLCSAQTMSTLSSAAVTLR